MKFIKSLINLPCIFALSVGLSFGLFFSETAEAGKNDKVKPDLFLEQSSEDAAANLLEKALIQAENGSWERIAVAQIHYLSGDKERGEEIFAGIKKKKAGDWIRMGRIYYRAGDWEKARAAFEQVVERAPKDEDWLAEIGAYYNLQGDRAKAEELFARSFKLDPDNLYNTLKAAGSYVGVVER